MDVVTETNPIGIVAKIKHHLNSRPRTYRWIAAGPLGLIATAMIIVGMVFYIPQGGAQVDNLVIPVILFPLIWAAVFTYTILDESLPRLYLSLIVLILANTGLLVFGG
ncbi:MAG: hypothetical protein AAGF71_01610 [Pseudomonadota bacterium]